MLLHVLFCIFSDFSARGHVTGGQRMFRMVIFIAADRSPHYCACVHGGFDGIYHIIVPPVFLPSTLKPSCGCLQQQSLSDSF